MELLHMSVRRRLEQGSYSELLTEVEPLYASTQEQLTATINKDDKEKVVKQHKTRFLKVAPNESVLQLPNK